MARPSSAVAGGMHYGLSLPNGGACADPRTQAEFAALAEAAGFEGIFLEDYLVYQNKSGVRPSVFTNPPAR